MFRALGRTFAAEQKSRYAVNISKPGSFASPGFDAHSMLVERFAARVKFLLSIFRKPSRPICLSVAKVPISKPRATAASRSVVPSLSALHRLDEANRDSAEIGTIPRTSRRLSICRSPREAILSQFSGTVTQQARQLSSSLGILPE
jgi:hypothetical protein